MGESFWKKQGPEKEMIIAVDFDGTCVAYAYPKVGGDIGSVPVLLALSKKHKLLLLTNRSGRELDDAVNWFKAYGIPLWAVNKNPLQWKFSQSPKVFANLYIDDAAVGCPLCEDPEISEKPFADWQKIKILLKKRGAL